MTLTVPVNADLDSYDIEQDAIRTLTRDMSPETARLVRQTIQRAVDHGRALDLAQTNSLKASHAVEKLGHVPTPGEWVPKDQEYFDLIAEENRQLSLVDNLRRMLGVRV